MYATFVGVVDTVEQDETSMTVTFTEKPGSYSVSRAPEDVMTTLREALQSGREVQVTYDPDSLEVIDVVRH